MEKSVHHKSQDTSTSTTCLVSTSPTSLVTLDDVELIPAPHLRLADQDTTQANDR